MPSWVPPQTLDPTRVKAVLTTRWTGTAYRSTTIRRVESYSIASNLDSDADSWTLEVGNPDADLNPTLVRDNEIRVKVFGAGANQNVPILVGITDDVTYTEQGTLQLSGRDMSCIPVDSDHFPNIIRGLSPTKIIELEAKELKCATKFAISPIIGGPKKQETDGSEKYWEFWYRMVRKDGMWIWMLSDGTLVVSKLNYNDPPVYHFISGSAKNPKNTGILVESVNWHKSTQTRIGKLAIEWRTNTVAKSKKQSYSIFEDKTNGQWLKRPNRIIQDKHAVDQKSAYKVAVEELFETRVGAIEIVLTVQDPGFFIKQNRMATLDIPELELKGDWFVVGSTMRGDAGGFVQEVRLREKKFAISKRVPDDPEWKKDPAGDPTGTMPTGQAAEDLLNQMEPHPEWYECFLNAAQKWHGKFDLALYMAVLLAICSHETGFTNVRSNDMARDPEGGGQTDAPGDQGVEWYDIREKKPTPNELDKWKQTFANKGGDGYLPSGYACAVGPMQLFSRGYKETADTMKGGKVDEFFGDRWTPCVNIMVAAEVLNSKSKTSDGSEGDLWRGVCNYGGQGLDDNGMCGYAYWVKNAVMNDPGWLALVQAALNSSVDTGGPDPPAQTGSAAKFARRLIDLNALHPPKFRDDNGQIMSQVRKVARGEKWHSKCGDYVNCDERVLAACVYLIDECGFTIGLYALCEDHDCFVKGSSPPRRSAHTYGRAMDIDSIGKPGVGHFYINTPSSVTTKIVIEAMELLKDGGWLLPSQIICNGVGHTDPNVQQHQWNDGPTSWITGGHTDHIHVGYR